METTPAFTVSHYCRIVDTFVFCYSLITMNNFNHHDIINELQYAGLEMLTSSYTILIHTIWLWTEVNIYYKLYVKFWYGHVLQEYSNTCMRHFINKNWAIFITPRLPHVLWTLAIRDTKWKPSGCLSTAFLTKAVLKKGNNNTHSVHVHVYGLWNNAERCNVLWVHVVNFNDEIKTTFTRSRGSIYMTMCTL